MLSHQIAVYVPDTVEGGRRCGRRQSAWASRIAATLARDFGGATEVDGLGEWIAADGKPVCEPVKIDKLAAELGA